MMITHVSLRFQPVGHGTFFTGVVDDRHGGTFSWVYDCGSMRFKHLSGIIDGLDRWKNLPEEIDLLVVSHLDSDHVNGISKLLGKRRVKRMVFPYLDLGQQLEGVMELLDEAGDEGAGNEDEDLASAALLQFAPISWLAANGLQEQVNELVFVRGDSGRVEGDGQEQFPDVGGSESDFAAVSADYVLSVDGFGSNHSSVKILNDSVARMAGRMPVEFTFFNSRGSDLFELDSVGRRVTIGSRKTVQEIQRELGKLLLALNLNGKSVGSGELDTEWRKKLRGFYDVHFGGGGVPRNNISLCLMVRPITKEIRRCDLFDANEIEHSDRTPGQGGLLLLGDLAVDTARFGELQHHFGPARWAELNFVQVPHHGSKHSWETGTAAKFGAKTFVHCAPDDGKHPHDDVSDDLSAFGIVNVASYYVGVRLDYHF